MTNGGSRFQAVLEKGVFGVTIECNPPKGTDVTAMLEATKGLLGNVHGVNVTDNTAAVMRAGSISVCRLLYEQGHDPIMQVTSRDRNRIGIQSDLLGAHLLGIRNVLCLAGDPPTVGDHKDAKPVYDLDSVQIMNTARSLNQGKDLVGNPLKGNTNFFIGGAVAPGADKIDIVHQKLNAKVQAGAGFFQTQAVFCSDVFRDFMREARRHRGKILAGILVLRSADMVEYLNAHIPGIHVPEPLIAELRGTSKGLELDVGIDIAVRTIKAVRPLCDGVHVMAGRAMDRLPEILTKAGLA